MTLTRTEQARLESVEAKVAQLGELVKGTGSKNMLNRLLVLCQEQTKSLEAKVDALETEAAELLTLARKLQ